VNKQGSPRDEAAPQLSDLHSSSKDSEFPLLPSEAHTECSFFSMAFSLLFLSHHLNKMRKEIEQTFARASEND